MDLTGTDRKLKIASFNVQGLRNAKKRRTLFRQFKKQKYDIITIQEAYLLNEDKPLIEKEWEGQFHISEGTKRSKGLLTLFNKSLKEDEINSIFINNRVIISSVNFDENVIKIINIYGPSGEQEKITFFQDLTTIIDTKIDIDNDNWLVMGDANIVQCNKKDIIGGTAHSKTSVAEFNKFINNFELNDIWRIQNPNEKEYTWGRKNSRTNTFIARRLDYILTNNRLSTYCQETAIHGIGFSDHRMVTLSFNFSAFTRGPPQFKLNTALLKDITFVNIVKKEISDIKIANSELDPHFLWELVKIKIKTLAISYGKKKAQERKRDKNQIMHELAESEKKLAKEPANETHIKNMTKIKNQLEVHLLKETEGARIRAGIKWAERGEKNNKFFLSLEAQRSRNDTIFRMLNHENEIVTDNDGILDVLSSHFEKLYMNPPNPLQEELDDTFCTPEPNHQLSDEEADAMEQAVTLTELHKAMASMKNGSSPGMDGLPVEVFKVFWIDLKDILHQNILHSFEMKALSFSQTHGMIKLIYKGNGANRENVSSWRPLTLLNADYKIIAKLIARRLNAVLDKIIAPDQNAFIKGRNAADMIRQIDDIIELEKLKGKNSILLSIDYAKAFDTLSSKAILKAMKIHGFKNNLLKWIEILLAERKSCVKNNNYISKFIEMERGVRQGCPLSPLLFICTVELLARSIRNDNSIKGITVIENGRPKKIKLFADDITLLLKDQIDFREVLSKIKLFSDFSGLKLNMKKSMAMILDSKKNNTKTIQGIQVVEQVKILGIHFSTKAQPCNIDDNYDSKIIHLENVCKLWSKRNLSIIGKIIIIKTFGISIFTHILNSIGMDEQRITKINQILYRFIWNKSFSKTKTIEKVKRTVLCNDKKDGGLAMIDISQFQAGFYLKWAEQLLNGKKLMKKCQ